MEKVPTGKNWFPLELQDLNYRLGVPVHLKNGVNGVPVHLTEMWKSELNGVPVHLTEMWKSELNGVPKPRGKLFRFTGFGRGVRVYRMSKLIPAQVNRLERYLEFQQADQRTPELAYLGRLLVQCTLPHHNPGAVPQWSRRNGDLILSVLPGTDAFTGKSYGYPWGVLPRLLLFWMISEAVTTKQRKLSMGRSLSDFMRALGLNPRNGGGARSDAKRLSHAMHALFNSRIRFDFRNVRAGGRGFLDMPVASSAMNWWETKENQDPLFESWIELGEKFHQAICDRPVPLNISALRMLKNSSLALDLYAWATHRVSYLSEPAFIPWDQLATQFGSDYKSVKEFARKGRAALRKVMLVYPALRVQFVRGGGKTKGGIRLYPSPTAVPQLIEAN